MAHCDGCNKDRRDVQSCGRDANGDADAPDLCFLCRKLGEKGKTFDRVTGKYVPQGAYWAAQWEAERAEMARGPHAGDDDIPF